MAKIIGIHGKAESGKDTVARHLTTYYARNFRSIAFADPIRAALKAIFGWDDSYFDRPLKEQVIPEIGKSPRQIMQTMGTDWGRELVNDNIWLQQAQRRIEPLLTSDLNVLITDVRFENEAQFIREQGGEVWHIVRPAAGEVASHKSEAGVKFVRGVDKRILNDQTLGWLFDTAEKMAKEVIAEQEALEVQRQAHEEFTLRSYFNEDGSAKVEDVKPNTFPVDVEIV